MQQIIRTNTKLKFYTVPKNILIRKQSPLGNRYLT